MGLTRHTQLVSRTAWTFSIGYCPVYCRLQLELAKPKIRSDGSPSPAGLKRNWANWWRREEPKQADLRGLVVDRPLQHIKHRRGCVSLSHPLNQRKPSPLPSALKQARPGFPSSRVFDQIPLLLHHPYSLVESSGLVLAV